MPTFALGERQPHLHSIGYALLVFLLLLFFSPFSGAVYNDVGNDSCLTIFSNDWIYRPNNPAKPNVIDVYLTLENKCGSPITANVGLLVETRHKESLSLKKALVENVAIGSKQTANVLDYKPGKKSFEAMRGWESVALKDGNTEIYLELEIPKEEGEFTITAFNPLNPAQHSTLDPTYTGSGTLADPYVITTCVELQDMNAHLNDATVYFKLGNDIDCTDTKNWDTDTTAMQGFDPIGTAATPFKGHFDGDYHKITNLVVYREALYAGLFGVTSGGARISNLGLIDFNVVSTTNSVGALIGDAQDTDLNTIYALGGWIKGANWVGGLIGAGDRGDMNSVYTKDMVITGTNIAGGIVAYTNGILRKSYSTAEINGGGGEGALVGGTGTGTADNSYWNQTDSTIAVTALGTELTQANMYKQAQYVGWDFDGLWSIVEDVNTPKFKAFGEGGPPYVPVVPDFNFISIEGTQFVFPTQTFAYYIDGNLEIDFNVFLSDNNRLLLDLNYATVPFGGTNNAIINDLNLNSDVCPDQDWSDVPSACHWDFNINRNLVPDGNYYLVGNLYRKNKDANHAIVSATTFLVANDVNVVVKVPIDEETGLPIDTDHVYTWLVRIYDVGGLQYYPGQVDQNGFLVSIGSDIIIEVDTNTSDFYPRQYALSFDVPTATYTLQPYLIKQAVSGNFIFNVTNLSTLAPIYNVEIRINGFVPGLGTPGIQTITTDSAGVATIPLRLNTDYTAYFYYNGSLVHTAHIRPTTASLFYQVQLDLSSTIVEVPPDYGGLKVLFYPTGGYLLQQSDGDVDINASITMITKAVQKIRIQVFDSNGCRFTDRTFTTPWTDGNTAVIGNLDLNSGSTTNIYTGDVCEYDEMYSVWMLVDVNSTDGNQFQAYSVKWQLVQENNYKYNLLYLLPNIADSINGPNGKLATTFIAFLVLITAISAVGAVTSGEPIMAVLLTLGILGFFVRIDFVDFLPFSFICLATFFGILYMYGRFGV